MKNLKLLFLFSFVSFCSFAQETAAVITIEKGVLSNTKTEFSNAAGSMSAKILSTDNGTITVQIEHDKAEAISYQFLSSKGTVLEQGTIQGVSGQQLFKKDAAFWPTGTYRLVLSTASAYKTLRFINP